MQRYPLDWPPAWPRTKLRKRAVFGDKTLNRAVTELMRELSLLGALDVVISANLELRKSDNLPKSGQRQPEDRGVAVYFNLNKNQQCIPCDKWTTIEDNVWAVKKTVEALRGLERWGAKEMVRAAFTGFKALPEYTGDGNSLTLTQGQTINKPWHEVLGLGPDAPLPFAEEKYKKLAQIHHPDQPGGSHIKMSELNGAIDQARKLHDPS